MKKHDGLFAKRMTGRAAATLLALAMFSTGALAQGTDYQALVDEVQRLKRDLQDVQREVYSSYSQRPAASQTPAPPMPAPGSQNLGTLPRNGALSGPVTPGTNLQNNDPARTLVRLSEMEASLARVTGQLEEMNFRIDQLSQQVITASGDADFRFRALEEKAGIASISSDPLPAGTQQLGATRPSQALPVANANPNLSTVPSTGPVTLGARSFNTTVNTVDSGVSANTLSRDPVEQYEAAKTMLLRGDFGAAEGAFATFVDQHGENELAGDAQYWLGETYFVRGAYQQAAKSFTNGLSKYPESSRGPDSLLKLGMSLVALEQKDAACKTFKEMDRRFPNAMKTVVQRVKVEKNKAKCR